MTPTVSGKYISNAYKSDLKTNPKILAVSDPSNPAGSELYYITKEELVENMFISKDIDEAIFNNPRFENSYNDIVPGNWSGLPQLKSIGEDYSGVWVIDYKRNILTNETYNGVQEATNTNGRKLIRMGSNGTWGPWQLLTNIPFGTVSAMLIPANKRNGNYMGWLPFNGHSYSKTKYPALANALGNTVTNDGSTFTLPDISNKYLTQPTDTNLINKFGEWKIPNITGSFDIMASESDIGVLIRKADRLFSVERVDKTTAPFLDKNIFKNPVDGSGADVNNKGLTQRLTFDNKKVIASKNVSNKVEPDSYYITGWFIYAGYPQN